MAKTLAMIAGKVRSQCAAAMPATYVRMLRPLSKLDSSHTSSALAIKPAFWRPILVSYTGCHRHSDLFGRSWWQATLRL